MKNLLLIASFFIWGLSAHAGIDKGNGGSASESYLAGQQAQLESVALKIRIFFLKNEVDLKSQFPEIDIQKLTQKIKNSDIRVVNEDKLIDKNGKNRTCLNFPDTSLIECSSSGIEPIFDQPSTLFVLVFHEYLGLIGVEETSSANSTIIAGYSISKRLAAYVTKVNDYDLVISKDAVQEEVPWSTMAKIPSDIQKAFKKDWLYRSAVSHFKKCELYEQFNFRKLSYESKYGDQEVKFTLNCDGGSRLLDINGIYDSKYKTVDNTEISSRACLSDMCGP